MASTSNIADHKGYQVYFLQFLYYRQNTLRKKRELVANFTGRRQERPSLEPEDLDIPDVPVVRKRKGPVPLPIEESRARRRATRARFREKKRAEKREAQRREAEKTQGEEQSKETAPSKQQSTAGAEGEDKDGANDAEEGSSESKKSPRIRKAGGNRNRVQQPHHRVLMKNKQLSKRKRVAEKREKRHTESSSEEKQVTVTGSLGPFSLLLQAFSIDIPTVLQAIQTTPTASSTSTPSSGANGAADVVNTQREEISSGDHQPQENQSVSCNPQSSTDVTCSGQNTLAEPQNHEKEQITNEEKLGKGNDSLIDRHQAAKSTDAEPAVGSQISNEESNSAPSNAHAPVSTDRVETGNELTAETPATSQATRRRAPAIPPLPPCLTTLKTFKSLLLLRPHLQQIAAMLNTSPADSTAGTVAYQRSSTEGAAGSHRNQISNVTFINENDVRVSSHESRGGVVESCKNIDGAAGKDAAHKSHNEIPIDEIVGNNHVVSRGHPRDTKGGSESGEQLPTSIHAVTEGRLSTGHSRLSTEGPRTPAVDSTGLQQIQISELPGRVVNREGQAISSCRGTDRVETGTVPSPTIVGNEQIDRSLVQNSTQNSPSTVAPGIRLNNTSYRNSYEYKMLSSRFSSLFLWPALLSKIRVKGPSQIGPVFAERHPPPSGGGGDNTVNAATLKRKPAALRQTDAIRRKRPGLAAVRMASSASLSTPGQQMCIVGQGSAIRKETPARQPDDPSVAFAASQLLSLRETSRSLSMPAASTSPCNTRKSRRKATPAKRSPNQTHSTCPSKRSKYLESSDSSPSSEDDSSFSEDDSLETEYLPVKSKYNAVATGAAMETRQSSQKTQNLVVSDAKLPSDIQAMPSGSSDQVCNADEITPIGVVNTGDSNDVSQPSLLVVQEGNDVRPAQGAETAGQQSGAAANQDLSKKSQPNKHNSPSSSSKREICKPDRNRGARWRAMLPNVDSEDSDSEDNVGH